MLGENRQIGKDWAYEASAELPLLMSGPGVGVGTTSALASMVDVRATLTNLAGVGGDVAYDGRSLAQLFSGTPAMWRKRLLFERPPSGTSVGWYALYEPPHIYIEWTTGAKELYDLVADPGEPEEPARQSPGACEPLLAASGGAQGGERRRAQAGGGVKAGSSLLSRGQGSIGSLGPSSRYSESA
jgi:arylsulfatase A-like enzyme